MHPVRLITDDIVHIFDISCDYEYIPVEIIQENKER